MKMNKYLKKFESFFDILYWIAVVVWIIYRPYGYGLMFADYLIIFVLFVSSLKYIRRFLDARK
jgi:uncharacterized membrane protein